MSSEVSEIQQEEKPEKKVKNKKERVKKEKNKNKDDVETQSEVTAPQTTEGETPLDPSLDNSADIVKPISVKKTTKQSPEPVEVINRNGVEKKVIKKIDR